MMKIPGKTLCDSAVSSVVGPETSPGHVREKTPTLEATKKGRPELSNFAAPMARSIPSTGPDLRAMQRWADTVKRTGSPNHALAFYLKANRCSDLKRIFSNPSWKNGSEQACLCLLTAAAMTLDLASMRQTLSASALPKDTCSRAARNAGTILGELGHDKSRDAVWDTAASLDALQPDDLFKIAFAYLSCDEPARASQFFDRGEQAEGSLNEATTALKHAIASKMNSSPRSTLTAKEQRAELLCAMAGEAALAGQLDTLQRVRKIVLREFPLHLGLRRSLAEGFWALGNKPEAITHATFVARHRLGTAEDCLAAVRLLERSGRPQEALDLCEKARSRHGRDSALRVALALMMLRKADPKSRDRAIGLLTEESKLRQLPASACIFLAAAKSTIPKKEKEAAEHYWQAFRRADKPLPEEVLEAGASLYLRLNLRGDRVIALLQELRSRQPMRQTYVKKYVEALRMVGRNEEADEAAGAELRREKTARLAERGWFRAVHVPERPFDFQATPRIVEVQPTDSSDGYCGLARGTFSDGRLLVEKVDGNGYALTPVERCLFKGKSRHQPAIADHGVQAENRLAMPRQVEASLRFWLQSQKIGTGSALDLVEELSQTAHDYTFVVGGLGSRIIAGESADDSVDLDLVTTLLPSSVSLSVNNFLRQHQSDASYRSNLSWGVTRIQGSLHVDIASIRVHGAYMPAVAIEGSRGRSQPTGFGVDLTRDAEARDFCSNAVYCDIARGIVLDPTGQGVDDLLNKRLTLSSPATALRNGSLLGRLHRMQARGYAVPAETKEHLRRTFQTHLGSAELKETLVRSLDRTVSAAVPSPDVAARLARIGVILNDVLSEAATAEQIQSLMGNFAEYAAHAAPAARSKTQN